MNRITAMRRLRSSLHSATTAIRAGRAAIACLMLGATSMSASGQLINTPVPKELQGVDIIEKQNNQLPLDAIFTDESGNEVRLGDFFKGGKEAGGPDAGVRPVILQIGYYKCPMLCGLVLNGLVDGLKNVDWNAGETFEVVAITVNPKETPELAKIKRDGYLLEYNRPGGVQGFHFLTGPASSSHAVADAVGFQFREQENGEIAHAAAIFLITPDGRVSRYLYGAKFSAKDLKFGLMEAGEGKVGSTLERFILWCHMYDPDAQGYVLFAQRLMTIGGAVTLVVIVGVLGWFWFQEWRRRKLPGTASLTGPAASDGGATAS